jgi:hypothetical protein
MKRSFKLAVGAVAVSALLLSSQMAKATVLVTIDGTDEQNSERGTPAAQHVAFTFVFNNASGTLTATNAIEPHTAPGFPSTDFFLAGSNPTDASGFGAGLSTPISDLNGFLELSLTAQADETATRTTLDVQEADGDEYQYSVPLPAPGASEDFTVQMTAANSSFHQGSGDGVPSDSPITQIQLQLPFANPLVTDYEVHFLNLESVPEPTSLAVLGLGSLMGLGRRRR